MRAIALFQTVVVVLQGLHKEHVPLPLLPTTPERARVLVVDTFQARAFALRPTQ